METASNNKRIMRSFYFKVLIDGKCFWEDVAVIEVEEHLSFAHAIKTMQTITCVPPFKIGRLTVVHADGSRIIVFKWLTLSNHMVSKGSYLEIRGISTKSPPPTAAAEATDDIMLCLPEQ